MSQVSGTSRLLLHLRCDGHFWLSAVCHTAELKPLLSLSVLSVSRYILFKVRKS